MGYPAQYAIGTQSVSGRSDQRPVCCYSCLLTYSVPRTVRYCTVDSPTATWETPTRTTNLVGLARTGQDESFLRHVTCCAGQHTTAPPHHFRPKLKCRAPPASPGPRCIMLLEAHLHPLHSKQPTNRRGRTAGFSRTGPARREMDVISSRSAADDSRRPVALGASSLPRGPPGGCSSRYRCSADRI